MCCFTIITEEHCANVLYYYYDRGALCQCVVLHYFNRGALLPHGETLIPSLYEM